MDRSYNSTLALFLILGAAASASAQPATTPAPSGVYESFSPVHGVPVGSITASEPGDLVRTAAGGVRTLRSVQTLPPGPLRLGRNLRTASGTFGAGGLLFRSESPRRCP